MGENPTTSQTTLPGEEPALPVAAGKCPWNPTATSRVNFKVGNSRRDGGAGVDTDVVRFAHLTPPLPYLLLTHSVR
jgi:hypothetical protein